MTTLQELPAEVQARVAGIIAKWKASHDSRAFDWLDVGEFRWDEQRGYFAVFRTVPAVEQGPAGDGKTDQKSAQHRIETVGELLDELRGNSRNIPAIRMAAGD